MSRICSCENFLCIYFHNNTCGLDEVDINFQGVCGSFMSERIPDKSIAEYRRRRLQDLCDRYEIKVNSVK